MKERRLKHLKRKRILSVFIMHRMQVTEEKQERKQ